MNTDTNVWSSQQLSERDQLLQRLARLQYLRDKKKSDSDNSILEELRQKQSEKRKLYQENLQKLDERLNELNLNQRPIGPDGNCFYLALCDQLYRNNIIPDNYDFTMETVMGVTGQYPLAAKKCRFEIVLHMARNNNDYRLGYNRRQFGQYLQRMRRDGSWAGGQEIAAAADLYNVCIECFSVSSDGLNMEIYRPRHLENESEEDWEKRCSELTVLRLCLHGNHFWSTRSPEDERIENERDKKISEEMNESDEDDEEESDDEEEVVCQVFKYKGEEYLLGQKPESEKNKIFGRYSPNDYLGRLVIKDGEDYIDFTIPE